MTHAAALRVAVRDPRAEHHDGEAPCPSDQPGFAPMDRWALLDLATKLRKSLRLTTNDIAVLRALLSFLPVRTAGGKDAPVTPATLTVVFASNEALSHRAGGMDDRVLRHAFRRLAEAGLLERRDSATGKRFPVRRGGRIVAAYGLDLAPGFRNAPALSEKVRHLQEQEEAIRALRAEIFARRRALITRAQALCSDTLNWLADLTQRLRRKQSLPDLQTLTEELARIEQALGQNDPSEDVDNPVRETRETPACDGRIYRHTESEQIDMFKPAGKLREGWSNWSELRSFFVEEPRTLSDLRDILCRLAQMLRIGQNALGEAVTKLGWVGLATVMNRLLERAGDIGNPAGYLLAMVRAEEQGTALPSPG